MVPRKKAMETVFSSDIAWISVEDPIEIDQRDIYPVAKISVSKGCGCILVCSVSPEALLIVEPARAYAVSYLLNNQLILLATRMRSDNLGIE